MRIAVASEGPEPSSSLSSVFGRAAFFLVFEEDGSWRALSNDQGQAAAHGAGTAAAQLLAREGVTAVISREFGPKALEALRLARVRMLRPEGSPADARAALSGPFREL